MNREEIEGNDWKFAYRLTQRTDVYTKGEYKLFFNNENNRVRIGKDVEESFMYPFGFTQLFDGTCKLLNEFILVQILIGIE